MPSIFLDSLDRVEVAGLAAGARRAPAQPHTGRAPAAALPVRPSAPAVELPSPSTPVASEPAVAAVALDDLDDAALRDAVSHCTLCRLHETRTQTVYSDGHPDARVMVVGEAPGANEDQTGIPFVGKAGKLLDLMLAAIGLSRAESVYICNVLKCRPPGNMDPKPAEIDCCSPYLKRQIELVKPEVILAVGSFSARLLTGQTDAALGALRGTVHDYQGVPLVATYHPAALLRNRGWSRPAWDDLQLLRRVMEGP